MSFVTISVYCYSRMWSIKYSLNNLLYILGFQSSIFFLIIIIIIIFIIIITIDHHFHFHHFSCTCIVISLFALLNCEMFLPTAFWSFRVFIAIIIMIIKNWFIRAWLWWRCYSTDRLAPMVIYLQNKWKRNNNYHIRNTVNKTPY